MIPLDNLIQPIWEVSPYPIAVINFDRDPQRRKFLYVNSAFTELTGYRSTEAVDHPATLLNGPKTSQAAIQKCEASIAQGKPCKTTLVHYRKDGSEYPAEATVAPLIEPDGSAQFLILIETMNPSPNYAAATDDGVVVSLALPMPLKEFPAGYRPGHLGSHPELDDLQALWTKLRGNRPMPRREDLDLRIVSRWASHLSIATVMPNGRFQFRLFGTELSRVYGQDLTGRFLDELTPRDLWSVIILHYQEVAKTLRPLFAPISIANGQWYSEVSRLLLPLADGDPTKPAFILAADYVRSKY
jgi:PAS domain S-box-containing protein